MCVDAKQRFLFSLLRVVSSFFFLQKPNQLDIGLRATRGGNLKIRRYKHYHRPDMSQEYKDASITCLYLHPKKP